MSSNRNRKFFRSEWNFWLRSRLSILLNPGKSSSFLAPHRLLDVLRSEVSGPWRPLQSQLASQSVFCSTQAGPCAAVVLLLSHFTCISQHTDLTLPPSILQTLATALLDMDVGSLRTIGRKAEGDRCRDVG